MSDSCSEYKPDDDDFIVDDDDFIFSNNHEEIPIINNSEMDIHETGEMDDEEGKNMNDDTDLESSENDTVEYDDVTIEPGRELIEYSRNFSQEEINFLLSRTTINKLINPNQADLGRLVQKYNKTIRKYYNAELFVWDNNDKLWYSNNILFEITTILRSIYYLAFQHEKISAKQFGKAYRLTGMSSYGTGIKKYIHFKRDIKFERGLNTNSQWLPMKPGRKINLRTKEIVPRTKKDLWSYELTANYKPNLTNEQNIFYKFVKDMFPTPIERDYFLLLCGEMITIRGTENIIIIWEQAEGGGGKTIFMSCLDRIFPGISTQLDRNTILHNKGNVGAEMNKLKTKRLAFIDEAAQKNSGRKKQLYENNILQIAGGGSLQPRDCHQKGSETTPWEALVTLILFGNHNLINSHNMRIHSLDRRVAYVLQKVFFRNKGDPRYDEFDPHCKPKNMYIRQQLLNQPDHIFTFFINAASNLLNSGVSIIEAMPAHFREAWLNTANSKDIFDDFIKNMCQLSPIHLVELKIFRNAINKYQTTKKFKITDLEALIKNDPRINETFLDTNNIMTRHISGLTVIGNVNNNINHNYINKRRSKKYSQKNYNNRAQYNNFYNNNYNNHNYNNHNYNEQKESEDFMM